MTEEFDFDVDEIDMERFGEDGLSIREIALRLETDAEALNEYLDMYPELREAYNDGKEEFMYHNEEKEDINYDKY